MNHKQTFPVDRSKSKQPNTRVGSVSTRPINIKGLKQLDCILTSSLLNNSAGSEQNPFLLHHVVVWAFQALLHILCQPSPCYHWHRGAGMDIHLGDIRSVSCIHWYSYIVWWAGLEWNGDQRYKLCSYRGMAVHSRLPWYERITMWSESSECWYVTKAFRFFTAKHNSWRQGGDSNNDGCPTHSGHLSR